MASAKWKFWSLTAAELRIVEQCLQKFRNVQIYLNLQTGLPLATKFLALQVWEVVETGAIRMTIVVFFMRLLFRSHDVREMEVLEPHSC